MSICLEKSNEDCMQRFKPSDGKNLELALKTICLFEKEEKPDLKWEIKQLLVSAFTQLFLSEWGAIRNMTTPAKAIDIIRENLITKLHIYHYVIIQLRSDMQAFLQISPFSSFQKVIKKSYIIYCISSGIKCIVHVTERANSKKPSSHWITNPYILLSDDIMGFIDHLSIKNITWG